MILKMKSTKDKKILDKINKIIGKNYQHRFQVDNLLLSRSIELTDENLELFKDYITIDEIIRNRCDLTKEFINKYCLTTERLKILAAHQYLTEDFIEEHKDEIDWKSVSKYQKLSENFIERYENLLNWRDISSCQKLSESFIEKYSDKVDWSLISVYQRLSNSFIKKYKKKLYYNDICKYQKLNKPKFFKNFYNFCYTDRQIELINENWIYKSTEEKKQLVIDTGLYECHDDYFIAYKAIRGDRYSLYNFQYKYEKGGVYESWCDCSSDENSFGLSVGTYSYAENYGNYYNKYQLVRCKVKYEDIGRIVHNGDKIRCFKIEILD